MSIPATNAVWRDSNTKGQKRLLMLALADAVRRDCIDSCWPSVNTLAKLTRQSGRQVRRLLRELECDREIAVTINGGNVIMDGRVILTNKYRLTPGGAPLVIKPSSTDITGCHTPVSYHPGQKQLNPGHFEPLPGQIPPPPPDIAMSAKPVINRNNKPEINRQGQDAGIPANKTSIEKDNDSHQPRSGVKKRWRPSQDYSKATLPDIEDYYDIHACPDPVIAAMAVTGERDKRGWGAWVKWMHTASAIWGVDKAIEALRSALAQLWGEMKVETIHRPGAILNNKLKGLLPAQAPTYENDAYKNSA